MKYITMVTYALILSLLNLVPICAKNTPAGTDIHRYFCASYEEFSGNFKKAESWFEKLNKTPNQQLIAKGQTSFLLKTKQYQKIVNLIPQIGKLAEEDADLGWIIVQALEAVGENEQAYQRTLALSTKFKTHPEIAFAAANIYLQKKELHNALHIIENILNNSPRRPNNFIFYFLQAQINIQLNKKTTALESVKMALDLHPQFEKGWLLKAMLEEQMGKLEDAVAGYKTYLELTPTNSKLIEQHLLRLAFKQKILQTGKISASVEKNCVEAVLQLMEQKEYDKALIKIDQCLTVMPTDPEVLLIKIQILTALNKTDAIIKQMTNLISRNPHEELWYDVLHLLTRETITIQQAISLLATIEKKEINNHYITLYLADLYLRANNTNQAIVYLHKALKVCANHAIKARILYQLGSIYHQAGNHKELGTILEQALALEESFTPLRNLIAYHYATKGKKLHEAQKIMDELLKTEPDNPHYLDTQAVIYYKQGNYKKAEQLLQKAAKALPGDLTIAHHLGKTYYKQQKLDDAKTIITTALNTPNASGDKQKCEKLFTRLHQ